MEFASKDTFAAADPQPLTINCPILKLTLIVRPLNLSLSELFPCMIAMRWF